MTDFYILKLIFDKRIMLFHNVYYEIKSLYAGSVLGGLWFLLGPLLLMFMYAMLYLHIFKIKPASMDANAYVIYVLAGLTPYLSIIQSIMKGATSINQSKSVLFNTVYPAEFIPVRGVLVSILPMLFSLGVLLVYKIATFSISFIHIFLLFYILNCALFLIGLTLMLSLATLLLKDIENILQYLFMFLLFVTPIGFFPESLSAKLKLVVYLNPVFYLIRPFQDLLVYNQLPSPTVSLVATLISLLVFVLGSRFFRAFKAVAYEFI